MKLRKIVIALTVLLAVMTLCACGKSAQAKAADEKIMQIGSVSTESLADIEAARALVDALSEKDKSALEHYQTLLDAEKAYDLLMAQEVAAFIDTLQEITPDSSDNVYKAVKMYDALTDEQKALVENYAMLTQAEGKLLEYKISAMTQAVDTEKKYGPIKNESAEDLLNSMTVSAEEASAMPTQEELDEERFNSCFSYYCAWIQNGYMFPRVYLHFVNGSDKTIDKLVLVIQIRDKFGDLVNLDKYAKSPINHLYLVEWGPYAKDQGEKIVDHYFDSRKWKAAGTLEVTGMFVSYTDGSYEIFGELYPCGDHTELPSYLNNKVPTYSSGL